MCQISCQPDISVIVNVKVIGVKCYEFFLSLFLVYLHHRSIIILIIFELIYWLQHCNHHGLFMCASAMMYVYNQSCFVSMLKDQSCFHNLPSITIARCYETLRSNSVKIFTQLQAPVL